MDTIIRKTLLYKTAVEYGDYTANHVLGCAHGCNFPCYAFNMAKRFGNVKTYSEWIKPRLVANALDLLDKELPKLAGKIESIHLCFTTDPFMDEYPEVQDMSIKMIHRINHYHIPVVVLTKGTLPYELSQTFKGNQFGITLVSLSEQFRKVYEPFSSTYNQRIEALEKLHNTGCQTWVSIEPFPTPNIGDTPIEDILHRVAFVDKIVFGRLHYNKKVGEYKGYQNFYNETARKVIEFCQASHKKCHIKHGTYIQDGQIIDIDF